MSATTTLAQTEKENVIAAARALETAPLSSETSKIADRALKWTIQTEEVSLIACGNTFALFSDKKNKDASSLMTMAYMIGMAAYRIQNPTKDENAVQLAGLETALTAYEAAVKEKPKTKSERADMLLPQRSKGELAAAVNAGDCGKK
ncbi:MAG: hypothetical protein ABI646_09245 [Acidobacteriota bacterium]